MRKSAAPSMKKLQKFTSKSDLDKNISNQSNNLIGISVPKSRSTLSVLNILNKGSEESSTNFQKEELQQKQVPQCVSNGSVLYSVVFGKKSTKKHKTFSDDGVLEVKQTSAILRDDEGKFIGKLTNINPSIFEEGKIMSIGDKEMQIGEPTDQNVKPLPVDYEPPAKKIKKQQNFSLPFSSVVKRKTPYITNANYEPLILPIPPYEHQFEFNVEKKPVTEVSVDPCLAKVLRPHQRLGVIFLYKCVMGFDLINFNGAILADEMGLGKTLQCIALIWTLLKQGPYGNTPEVKKVLIVTPSSLASNWQKEFSQWLGQERIKTFLVDSKNKPKDYRNFNTIPVMIISYEMFVRNIEDLEAMHFDIMICDEGHRLKNQSTRVAQLLNDMNCKKRILLTGTPIQNDLQEFFSLVDFVNPGVLGNHLEFKRYFENPIVASREPDADEEVRKLGEERAFELGQKTNCFILRRTQETIDKYLPMKTETVVFCRPTDTQLSIYQKALDFWENRDTPNESVCHFKLILALKKICNHPCLIGSNIIPDEIIDESLSSFLMKHLPETFSFSHSGKMVVLETLLQNIREANERIVIVSNYTQTLDLLADLCKQYQYKYCRLDGSTPVAQRSSIVEKFNTSYSNTFVFLLSAKAGGVGLNLVGASRLVLFDSDWNPATDIQAMARIWRDGQKKSVFIYRFLTTGTIEEKIYQRQISKTGLSGVIVDAKSQNSIKLSDEELKDLFTLHEDTDCWTHASLECSCEKNGTVAFELPESLEAETNDDIEFRDCQLGVNTQPNGSSSKSSSAVRISELFHWKHFGTPIDPSTLSSLGLNTCGEISFLFVNKSAVD